MHALSMADRPLAYILNELRRIRENCVVLRQILLPDDIWPKYQAVSIDVMDRARHKPIILLALKYGYLSKITSPLHNYLTRNGRIKSHLKKQYLQDLRETWLTNDQSDLRHHQLSRIFLGKLTELQIAEWIEEQGWSVSNLAALCGAADIEAMSAKGDKFFLEVKFIGESDEIFQKRLEECGGSFNSYDGANYVLFRSYEAARQLQSFNRKFIIIVINNLAWPYLSLPINDGYINWDSPMFFLLEASNDWHAFLHKQKEKYRDIDDDLNRYFRNINQLWIVRQGSEFEYSLEKVVSFC
jgi:hypothetical protein